MAACVHLSCALYRFLSAWLWAGVFTAACVRLHCTLYLFLLAWFWADVSTSACMHLPCTLYLSLNSVGEIIRALSALWLWNFFCFNLYSRTCMCAICMCVYVSIYFFMNIGEYRDLGQACSTWKMCSLLYVDKNIHTLAMRTQPIRFSGFKGIMLPNSFLLSCIEKMEARELNWSVHQNTYSCTGNDGIEACV